MSSNLYGAQGPKHQNIKRCFQTCTGYRFQNTKEKHNVFEPVWGTSCGCCRDCHQWLRVPAAQGRLLLHRHCHCVSATQALCFMQKHIFYCTSTVILPRKPFSATRALHFYHAGADSATHALCFWQSGTDSAAQALRF